MPMETTFDSMEGLELSAFGGFGEASTSDGRIGTVPASGAEYARHAGPGFEVRRGVIDPSEGANYGGGSSYAPLLPLMPSSAGLAGLAGIAGGLETLAADLLRYDYNMAGLDEDILASDDGDLSLLPSEYVKSWPPVAEDATDLFEPTVGVSQNGMSALEGQALFGRPPINKPQAAMRRVIAASLKPGTKEAGAVAQGLAKKSMELAKTAEKRAQAMVKARQERAKLTKQAQELENRAKSRVARIRGVEDARDAARKMELAKTLGRRAIRFAKVETVARQMARNAASQANVAQQIATSVLAGQPTAAATLAKFYDKMGEQSAKMREIRKRQIVNSTRAQDADTLNALLRRKASLLRQDAFYRVKLSRCSVPERAEINKFRQKVVGELASVNKEITQICSRNPRMGVGTGLSGLEGMVEGCVSCGFGGLGAPPRARAAAPRVKVTGRAPARDPGAAKFIALMNKKIAKRMMPLSSSEEGALRIYRDQIRKGKIKLHVGKDFFLKQAVGSKRRLLQGLSACDGTLGPTHPLCQSMKVDYFWHDKINRLKPSERVEVTKLFKKYGKVGAASRFLSKERQETLPALTKASKDIAKGTRAVVDAIGDGAQAVANAAKKVFIDWPCKLATSTVGKVATTVAGTAAGGAFGGPAGGAAGAVIANRANDLNKSLCKGAKDILGGKNVLKSLGRTASRIGKSATNPKNLLRDAQSAGTAYLGGGGASDILNKVGGQQIANLGLGKAVGDFGTKALSNVGGRGIEQFAQQAGGRVGTAILNEGKKQLVQAGRNYVAEQAAKLARPVLGSQGAQLVKQAMPSLMKGQIPGVPTGKDVRGFVQKQMPQAVAAIARLSPKQKQDLIKLHGMLQEAKRRGAPVPRIPTRVPRPRIPSRVPRIPTRVPRGIPRLGPGLFR